MKTPHFDKIKAALENPKSKEDLIVLKEILKEYGDWCKEMDALSTKGDQKIIDLVKLLNEYKDKVEIDCILKRGSPFLIRQKGQLKLDCSIIEEFLIRLMDKDIIPEIDGVSLLTGPNQTFMSLSFVPQSVASLINRPQVILKTKDQDFIVGKEIYYKFSAESSFSSERTTEGKLALAVIATECKVNYDKTMFQECAGTASRLKQGIPYAKYFVLVEFLDMTPEDCRLTEIDNVFLMRKTKRLPFEKRNDINAVTLHRKQHPIDSEVMINFVHEIKNFLSNNWYNAEEAIKRGSFN